MKYNSNRKTVLIIRLAMNNIVFTYTLSPLKLRV